MKTLKRKIAFYLTLCMLFTCATPAYAEEMTVPEAAEIPGIAEEMSPAEAEYVAAKPFDAEYEATEKNPEDNAIEKATPSDAKKNEEVFIRETVVDGIKITLTADPGVFPEDAELWAEKVEDAQDPITYIDYEDGVKIEKTIDDYIVMTQNITEFEPGRFYVVTENVSGHTRIKNNGTLASPSYLILTDGHYCDIFQGIENADGNSLVIYGQTENSGSFKSEGCKQCAGIGGGPNTEGGKLTINGGTVNVKGDVSAAGIGGGGFETGGEVKPNPDGGIIIINGGIVNAAGGSMGGAGIGGGTHGSGGTITINGGIVWAYGTGGGAGIGGGKSGNGGTIIINGGRVTGHAGGDQGHTGAGIGGGDSGASGTFSCNSNPLVMKASDFSTPLSLISLEDFTQYHQNYQYAYITYWINYTVKHYKQKAIGQDIYEEVKEDAEIVNGIPGEMTKAYGKFYEGYKEKPIVQETIKDDDSTVINVYYDILYNTITLDTNGHGTPLNAIKIQKGKVFYEPAAPTADGYSFAGWYIDPECTEKYTFGTTLDKDITIYAKWQAVVTLDAQGGTGGTATVSVATGSDMPEITVPERDEYEFRGYYLATDGNGKKYYNADGTSAACFDFDEPTTLYAYWRRHPLVPEFTVSFDSKGGSPVPEQIVASGSTALKSLATTEKEGYDFAGWFYLSDETSPPSEREFSFNTKVYKDYQLYAKWTPKKYEIRWLYENGELATTSMANYGELPAYPNESLFAKDGYAHIGWDPTVEIVTGPASYKAAYAPYLDVYHIVSFDSKGGSAVKAVKVLDNCTLASPSDAPKRTGYEFGGWKKTDGNAFGFGTEKVTEDMILTASWTPKEYVITWSVDGKTSTSSCAYGELPAYSGSTAKTGYVFTGWSPAIKAATAPVTYTAQYYEVVHVHTPQLVAGQAATCTEAGYKDCYQCTGCNEYFADLSCADGSKITNYAYWKAGAGKISAAGHKAVMIPQKDATTEADGYKAHWHCPICDRYFRDDSGSVGTEIGNAEALASWKTGEGRIEKTKPHAHAYGTATYLWGEDLSTCTAYHMCTEATCGHTEFETGTVTEESGKMKATFTNTAFETQTKAKPTPGHTHTFSGVWSTNEAAHWHAATCEHTDLAKDMAAHAWGTGDNTNKCTVCGYEKTSPEPEKVLVSFNTDGGSFVETQVITKGQKAVRPSDPVKTGYEFVNWYADAAGGELYDFNTAVTTDITVYAKWKKTAGREYTITWKDWDGNVLATSKVAENGLPKYPGGKLSRNGYNFTGWTPEIDLASADMTYTATYAPQTIINGGGGGGSSAPAAKKAAVVTFSPNWNVDVYGVWRITNSAGQVVTNAWLCDDAVDANGQNVWYLLGPDGAMLAAGLVQDNTGNFYSLETNHDGYFGMLRYTDGYYNCNGQQVYLKFSHEHNGTFGAVINADGIEKLKAIYGVTKYGIGNENAVYTKTF
ncbi:MAG: InlB B-repeat-containing protein [Eubacteriales bacterium]|nr:InlB B-repeat-containing protein [Eubacteriales bacterium]